VKGWRRGAARNSENSPARSKWRGDGRNSHRRLFSSTAPNGALARICPRPWPTCVLQPLRRVVPDPSLPV